MELPPTGYGHMSHVSKHNTVFREKWCARYGMDPEGMWHQPNRVIVAKFKTLSLLSANCEKISVILIRNLGGFMSILQKIRG